jgi:glutamate synthase domain-containing protein 3
MKIESMGMYYRDLNEIIANSDDKIIQLDNICGQRYIGCGLNGYKITINGTPGNALASYMDGSEIIVNGNAQDAIGDTMNLGRVVVHGSCGDTCGYAMRGGEIFIRNNTGYRTGIHMKEYGDMKPTIIVGGKTGDFLGEYLAGGMVLVLGIGIEGVPVGSFCGTGMHGGVIYIRTSQVPEGLPKQVKVESVDENDMSRIKHYVELYCGFFGGDADKLLKSDFIKLLPNSNNPYKQLYTPNY